MDLADGPLQQLETLITNRFGLCLEHQRKATLAARLAEDMATSGRSCLDDYLAWLSQLSDDHSAWESVVAAVTVGETSFLRNPGYFRALELRVLPELIASRREIGARTLRIWSAGCSTGEEAYSLAILLDRLLPDLADWSILLLATDLNQEALAVANRGIYREWALRGTPEWIRSRYFRRGRDGLFQIDPTIAQRVQFVQINLASPGSPADQPYIGHMDLVSCQNVLMYLAPAAVRTAVARLQCALAPGGWLVVSPVDASHFGSESLTPVNFGEAIFYRRASAACSLPDEPPTRPTTDGPGSRTSVSPREARVTGLAGGAYDLHQVQTLADRGELVQARKLCEHLCRLGPLDVEAHLLLGIICEEQGDAGAAIAAWRQVLYLYPDTVAAHFHLGALHAIRGEEQDGFRHMRTVGSLLEGVPPDQEVPHAGGLTAGRVKAMASAYVSDNPSGAHQTRQRRGRSE